MKKRLTILLCILAFVGFAYSQSGDPLPQFGGGILATATVPVNGTSEVQTITLTSFSGGTTTLGFAGKTATLVLSSTASNATINTTGSTALCSMATIGTGGVTVSTSGSTNRAIAVTFAGNLGKLDVPTLTATVVTGSNTAGVAVTTPGVTADGRSAPTGQLLINKGTGILYQNTSTTSLAPAWVKVSAE